MDNWNRPARLNVKVLIVLLFIVAVIGVSLFGARHIRKKVLTRMDLNAGLAAYKDKDWLTAYRHFQEYLGRNPDDLEIYKKYAETIMHRQPFDAGVRSNATETYRRILQMEPDPNDATAYEQLARIYMYTANFSELEYIAKQCMTKFPEHLKARLWYCTALVRLEKIEGEGEAREELDQLISELDALEDKPEEYVQACALRSEVELGDDPTQASEGRAQDALEFLVKAVHGVPTSVEALINRARFHRTRAAIRGITKDARSEAIAEAIADLEAADELGTEDPKIRSVLCAEWMIHNKFDEAADELRAVEDLLPEVIHEHFLDVNDWATRRSVLSLELAIRSGDAAKAASSADEARAALTEQRHRVRILDPAIVAYVGAGRAADANSCLTEYLGAMRDVGSTRRNMVRGAILKALVARAQNKPSAVIDILQPVALDGATDSSLWQLLAEAYRVTNQSSRTISALQTYLSLRPQDAQAALQLAEQYLNRRDWVNVSKYAGIAVSLRPDDIDAQVLRIEADVHRASEPGQEDVTRLEELSKELAALRQKYQVRTDIPTLQAMISLEMGQPEEAEKQLKLAIGQSDGALKLRAQLQLARHYYKNKNMTEAINACETACEDDPESFRPWSLLARLHATNADPNSARSTLEQGLDAVALGEEKRELERELAVLELKLGKLERARGIDRLTRLAEEDVNDVGIRTLLLDVREVLDDPNRAQLLVDELKAAEGQSGFRWRFYQAALWLSSPDWLSKQGDIVKALQYCIDAEPGWSEPALLLGKVYNNRLNDPQRAESVYRQVLARNPAAIRVARRLTSLLQASGRDAEEVLDLVKASPEAEDALNLQVALGSGDLAGAIEKLQVRLSNDDQDVDLLIMLAKLVYLQDRVFDDANEYLEAAEAVEPNSAVLIGAKAAILKADGQAGEARRVLDDYVNRSGAFGAYWLRAMYLAGEGELEGAEKDYEKLTTFADQGAVGYALLGYFYEANQEIDKAAETLDKGLKAHPADSGLKRRLMKALFRRDSDHDNDKERALEILGKLEEQLPKDLELMMIRASRLIKESTPQSNQDAREKLASIIKLNPTAVVAHSMLIRMAMDGGDYGAASTLASQAVASNPEDSGLLSIRSRVELEMGDIQLATQLARLAVQKDPDNVIAMGALVETARRSTEQRLLEEARKLVEAGLTRNPADERLLLYRAHVLTSLRRPEMAIPELDAYCQTEQGSSSVSAILTLADLHRLAGDLAESEQKIEQAELLDPNSQAVIHARVVWLAEQKRYDELEQISSAYLSAKEQNPQTLLSAASILSALSSTELRKEGITLFEHAVSLSPTSLSARLGLASALYQAGDVERSKEIYQKLRDQYANKYPENVQIFNDLAWIIQKHDHDYETALDLATKGLRAARNDNDRLYVLDTRGSILFNMERFGEAKEDFVKLVALALSLYDSPTKPQATRQARAYLQLGHTCAELGEFDQAKEHLNKALEIDQAIGVFTDEERLEIEKSIQK